MNIVKPNLRVLSINEPTTSCLLQVEKLKGSFKEFFQMGDLENSRVALLKLIALQGGHEWWLHLSAIYAVEFKHQDSRSALTKALPTSATQQEKDDLLDEQSDLILHWTFFDMLVGPVRSSPPLINEGEILKLFQASHMDSESPPFEDSSHLPPGWLFNYVVEIAKTTKFTSSLGYAPFPLVRMAPQCNIYTPAPSDGVAFATKIQRHVRAEEPPLASKGILISPAPAFEEHKGDKFRDPSNLLEKENISRRTIRQVDDSQPNTRPLELRQFAVPSNKVQDTARSQDYEAPSTQKAPKQSFEASGSEKTQFMFTFCVNTPTSSSSGANFSLGETSLKIPKRPKLISGYRERLERNSNCQLKCNGCDRWFSNTQIASHLRKAEAEGRAACDVIFRRLSG